MKDNGKTIHSQFFQNLPAADAIDVQIRRVNNQYTKFDTVYHLTILLNTSQEVLDVILNKYDIEIVPDILRGKKTGWMYELSQAYKFEHRAQLANLLAFLVEKKFIPAERSSELTDMLGDILPCTDAELTSLFNGEPLTQDYVYHKLSLPFDPYYDSTELHRTKEGEEAQLSSSNNYLYEEIKEKLSTLYKNQCTDLLNKLIDECKHSAHYFNNKYRAKLTNLIEEYQSKTVNETPHANIHVR